MENATVVPMPQLAMPKHLDKVRDGSKRSTIRKGHRDIPLGLCLLFSPEENLMVEITGSKLTTFGQLTEEDAKTDGFDSLSDLKEALRGFYGDLADHVGMTIVMFKP